jgi:hypothetical protein
LTPAVEKPWRRPSQLRLGLLCNEEEQEVSDRWILVYIPTGEAVPNKENVWLGRLTTTIGILLDVDVFE